MKTKTNILFIVYSILLFTSTNYAQLFKQLDEAYDIGQITVDEMILNKIYRIFDTSKVDTNYIPDITSVLKCGTEIITEYYQVKNTLTSTSINIIEDYLEMEDGLTNYISPEGYFKLSYTTTGEDAVPPQDGDLNGIPDFVEDIADYLDYSWIIEIDNCGFLAPIDADGDGYYNVSFKSMTDWGYTSNDGYGGTRIVLNNTFSYTTPTQDPAGDKVGLQKVTCAHELKHASQFEYSDFLNRQPRWAELDAVWAEELVYDYVNQSMLFYTGQNSYSSPFSSPISALDDGGGGSSEDYYWEDFLHQKFDNNSHNSAPILKAFMERRKNFYSSESVLDSYDFVLQDFGSSLREAFTEFIIWNFYTGDRTVPGFGYDEAGIAGFPEVLLKATHDIYPVNNGSGSGLDHLASNHIRLNPGNLSGLKINFNGDDFVDMNVVVTWTNGSYVRWEKMNLNEISNDGLTYIETKSFGALLPIITEKTGDNFGDDFDYSYSIEAASVFNIYFTNQVDTSNAGGNYIVDGDNYDSIPSGQSRNLVEQRTHSVFTNNERFVDWGGSIDYKHHDWNNSFSDNKLISNFQSTLDNNQDAIFIDMKYGKVEVRLDGCLVNGKGPGQFQDPWYVLSDGSQPGNYWKAFSSYYEPTGKDGATEKGVFLNQGYNPVNQTWTPPYYSVKADQVQDDTLYTTGAPLTGRSHKFYFQNWGGTNVNYKYPNNTETPVVFTLDGATAQANLKGTQLTNTSFQYGVGQRGFVRSTNGYLHNVYESMGDIFYERSTDNGTTWLLMNNGKPINPDYATASAKSPSVCFDASYNLLYVVYQSSTFPYDGIVLVQFNTSQLANTPNWAQSITVANFSYSNNYKPVIAVMGGSGVVVYDPPSTVTAGLKAFKFTIGSYPNYSLISTTEFTIPGADQNSSNPSIAAGCQYYYLVYQQAETSIRYTAWSGGSNPSTYSVVSSGSSYIFNVRPTISLTYCTYPVVSWIGGTYDYYHSGFYYGSCVLTRVGPTWGSIKIISTSNAQATNNNSTTEYGSEYKSIISYSYGSGPYTTKWVKRTGTSYTTPASLSYNGFPINGIFPQVSSGASTNDMKALVYNSNFLPYYYIQSTTSFGTVSAEVSSISGDNISLSKISENDTIVTLGRSGVASINDIEFVFEIGDIIVGDSIIEFIDIPDTLAYASTSELNLHTRTNNFTLNPGTNFYFSNIYYVVKKSNPDSALITTDAVNFKAELVNANTNQIVGTFDNITYNKNNLEKYASIDYSVDCSGIEAGNYYLRLVTNVNGNANYTLANIISDNTTLEKKNYNKVNFTGSEVPTTYDLAQNFPNPFNPSTTIRFQIPQDGLVTLKIYDILGAEVATIVNEEKVAGKYEVNFNASSLASGVYIYKIQAGSFTASKKLLLLK